MSEIPTNPDESSENSSQNRTNRYQGSGNREQLWWSVDKGLIRDFENFCENVVGDPNEHLERAMIEYLDNDRYSRVEEEIREIKDILEKDSSTTPGGGAISQQKEKEKENTSRSTSSSSSSSSGPLAESYDPDAESHEYTLDSTDQRTILNHTSDDEDAVINPEHVDWTSTPNSVEKTADVVMACARYMYDDLLVHSLNEDGTIEESDFVDVLKETIGASDYKVDQYVPLLLDRTYRSVDQSINDGEKYYQCSIHRDVYKERLNALKITIEGCVNGIDDDVDIEREKVAGNLSKLEDNRDEFVRFDVLDEGEVDRVENRLVEYLDDESVEDE